MKPIVIIGMGNALMSDEGIGGRVIQHLQQGGVPDHVEVLDLGTSWMSVLHEIENRERVIFVDCALMGEGPGSLHRFTPKEVVSKKVQVLTSQHEGDLLNTLALAERLGRCPRDVILFGIQPASIEPGRELSPLLEDLMPVYETALRQELEAALLAGVG